MSTVMSGEAPMITAPKTRALTNNGRRVSSPQMTRHPVSSSRRQWWSAALAGGSGSGVRRRVMPAAASTSAAALIATVTVAPTTPRRAPPRVGPAEAAIQEVVSSRPAAEVRPSLGTSALRCADPALDSTTRPSEVTAATSSRWT